MRAWNRLPVPFTALTSAFFARYFAARHASAAHAILPRYDDVDPVAGVLRLE
jgi:hypothetical protein